MAEGRQGSRRGPGAGTRPAQSPPRELGVLRSEEIRCLCLSPPPGSLQAGGGRGEAGSQMPQDVALETEGPSLGDPGLLLRMAPQTGTGREDCSGSKGLFSSLLLATALRELGSPFGLAGAWLLTGQ